MRTKKRKKRKISVTICIAAIHSNSSIIGVSDRMITAGDIEFEPPQPKILGMTTSIAIMTAGDANIQTQLYVRVNRVVAHMIDQNPQEWVTVEEVASLYRDAYVELRAELAEKVYLAPHQLTHETFIARQSEMSAEFISDLTNALQGYEIEDAHTIVAGIDDTGPHIFTVRNDEISLDDRIGFSAVGGGSNHALSHLMLTGHTPAAEEAKTLITVHQAKKKSEVTPGVGTDTDMFIVGPAPGTLTQVMPMPAVDLLKDLDGFYEKYKKEIDRLDKKTEDKIKEYVDNLSAKAQAQQASPAGESGITKGQDNNGKAAKKAQG